MAREALSASHADDSAPEQIGRNGKAPVTGISLRLVTFYHKQPIQLSIKLAFLAEFMRQKGPPAGGQSKKWAYQTRR